MTDFWYFYIATKFVDISNGKKSYNYSYGKIACVLIKLYLIFVLQTTLEKKIAYY